MPLELNGEPFQLTDHEVLKKYSKTMIFRVGKQYIKKNTDPDMPAMDIAPVHVPSSYNHYKMDRDMRVSQGVLRYYDAMSTSTENGRSVNNYTPQYIAIGRQGYMKCENPEMNYFLDNHPMNEKVKANSLHPNHSNTIISILSTYDKKDKQKDDHTKMITTAYLMNAFLGKTEEGNYTFDETRMKSIAHVVVKEALGRKMHHKLYDFESMDAEELRVELLRLSQTNPEGLYDIFMTTELDFAHKIMQWRKARTIEFQEGTRQWVLNNKKLTEPILTVLEHSDPVSSLVEFLRANDTFGKTYKKVEDRYIEMIDNIKKKDPALAAELK